MKFSRALAFAGMMAVSPALFAAAPDLLSVHVLNQQTGKPAAGVQVKLEQKTGDSWQLVNQASTDKDGRIKALWPEKAPATGDYRVTFETGNYFRAQNQETFFPAIPVLFHIADTRQHYHVPLLLSQYGYSTYRGS